MQAHSKLKIFVDCHVFDGTFQGTTTYLRGIYTELVKRTDIHFYFGTSDVSHLQTIFGTAPNITYLHYKSHNKFYRLLIDIPRLIKQNGIDYSHFQYVVPPVKNSRYIVSLHDVIFMEYPQFFPLGYRIKNGFLFRKSAKRADILLTISEYSRGQIKKHLGLNCQGLTVNTADDVFFEEYNKPAIQQEVKQRFGLENYWLFVSRWEPRKNHHGLLKAFYEGGFYNNYNLLFIGDDALENTEYNNLYNTLPDAVKAKVHKFTKVNFNDMLLLLRGAVLSVYPSVAEGFGIPPIEAAAAGVPVACSKLTSMGDFTFFKDTLFDPYDTADMIAKIKVALQGADPAIKQAIKEKYNWAAAANVVVEAIEKDSGKKIK